MKNRISNEEKLIVFVNKFWKPVQETLDILTSKGPDEVKAWFVTEVFVNAYTQIYMCCTAPVIGRPPSEFEGRAEFFYGKLIYERLALYMTKRLQKVSLRIELERTPEEAFDCYMQVYIAFETYCKIIEKIFIYIECHWIEMVNKRLGSQKEILSIEKLLNSLWLQFVVQPNLPGILIGAKIELKKSRELKLNKSRVADFIGVISLYSPYQESSRSQCATFNEMLIQLYEEDIKTFLAAIVSANNLDSEPDFSKCELIISTWNEEMERVKGLFGKSRNLMRKYKKILRENLLEPSIGLLERITVDSLRSPQINQYLISGVYEMYSAYNVLHPRLEQLFEQVFTELVVSKSVSNMSHIWECTIWADSLLRNCFEEKKNYISIIKRVLRPVFSKIAGRNYTSMLAARIDKVIRTHNALTVNSSEHSELYAMMTQLRFVEDKETLRANYAHFLALRLMTWHQQASDVLPERIKMEKQVIDSLRKTCGSCAVEQFNRMLVDVDKGKDNAKGLLPDNMSSDTQVMIFPGGYWPQTKSGWNESIWPKELQRTYGVAASNYVRRFSSRKLEWSPELSTVAVKMDNSMVTLSVVQYSFLFLLLKRGFRAPIADCWACFDITEEALASLVYGLTACGLVLTADNDYYINETALGSFPPRINLAFAARNRVPQQNQLSSSAISALNQPIDYDALIQCHLVRISKREGKKGGLLKPLLFRKTKDALSSRISLNDSQLEALLKILIEKKYLEIDTKGKYIKYCP